VFWVRSGPGDLVFLTWSAGPEAAPPVTLDRAYEEIGRRLAEDGLVILQERIFGDVAAAPASLAVRAASFPPGSTAGAVPPTYIEGTPPDGTGVAGIQMIAARPAASSSVELVEHHGVACGRLVEGADARYLALSDLGRLLPADRERLPAEEARATLRLAVDLLREREWSFDDVRRTWFFLDEILDWYDEFNRARNDVFTSLGLLNGSASTLIPASTGIHGRNALGHRCTFELLATRPLAGRELSVTRLFNPLQNEAPEYGSSFSRGLSVATESCRYFLVSGTASIDERGDTVHAGSFDRQVRRTLDNIESLLASGGAVFDDICQASVFVKRPEDSARLHEIFAARGLVDIPVVCTLDDICRDDLLVELDATAVIARPQRP
jgi:enamine deaminase RidA (YjgF/YER057c/UK114 family)